MCAACAACHSVRYIRAPSLLWVCAVLFSLFDFFIFRYFAILPFRYFSWSLLPTPGRPVRLVPVAPSLSIQKSQYPSQILVKSCKYNSRYTLRFAVHVRLLHMYPDSSSALSVCRPLSLFPCLLFPFWFPFDVLPPSSFSPPSLFFLPLPPPTSQHILPRPLHRQSLLATRDARLQLFTSYLPRPYSLTESIPSLSDIRHVYHARAGIDLTPTANPSVSFSIPISSTSFRSFDFSTFLSTFLLSFHPCSYLTQTRLPPRQPPRHRHVFTTWSPLLRLHVVHVLCAVPFPRHIPAQSNPDSFSCHLHLVLSPFVLARSFASI